MEEIAAQAKAAVEKAGDAVEDAGRAATKAARRLFFNPYRSGVTPAPRWIEYMARVGFLARGIVYFFVGALALDAASHAARAPDTRDALAEIGSAPFGRIALGLIAVGFLCFAAWRVIEGVCDIGRKGNDWKGLAVRAGAVIAGLVNVGLAVAAGLAAYGAGSPGGSEPQAAAAGLLAWPGGWVVLLALGLTILGVGISHFRQAYRADFMADYDATEMSVAERRWAKPVGRWGLAARGVTFCLIGLFLAVAAWRANAGQVKGLGEAFDLLARQPFGPVLLAAVAAGFVAYGVFCVSQAKYRRFAG